MMFEGGTVSGFEDRRPVPTVDFEYPEDDEQLPVGRSERAAGEALAAVLQWCTDGRTAASCGRRTLAVAFLLGNLPWLRTQRDLATRMGTTEAAAAQAVALARKFMGGRAET